jgi:hypothetical protein
MFNLAGGLFYLAVAAAAWRAASGKGSAGNAFHWRAVCLLFVGLAAWRIGYGEAMVQAWARDTAHAAGSYDLRRRWQAPVSVVMLLAGGGVMLWLALGRSADSLLRWSRFASLGLLAYSALRLVSFHPIDALIYKGPGPFHLNHIIDLGLAGVVGCCAILARRPTGRTRANRRAG